MIVCDDADLEEAAHWALSAVFISSGQMCLASERILVMDGIYDPFVARVVEIGTRLRQGPAAGRPGQIDVGAMTMPAQVDLVERQVKDAVSKGAKVLLGGKRGHGGRGQFFEPTILSGVTPEMSIAREETFGPVMSIFRVKDEEEAIALANSTEYGLGSTVFTTNQKRAKRIASQLVAGSTCVNAYGMNYMAQDLPFGGVRGSGYGRLNGREGLRGMCNVKSVVADRLPLHQPVKQYPVKPGDYERTRSVIQLLYGGSLATRARGLLGLVRKFRGAEGSR
jgi:acyl-CoA reductase-like NAD-dependent aldehyde dehydrogenase